MLKALYGSSSSDKQELKQNVNELRQENLLLNEYIEHLETRLETMSEEIKTGKEQIDTIKTEMAELRELLNNGARTRNMIIRSYSKNGLVSKFIPE